MNKYFYIIKIIIYSSLNCTIKYNKKITISYVTCFVYGNKLTKSLFKSWLFSIAYSMNYFDGIICKYVIKQINHCKCNHINYYYQLYYYIVILIQKEK